MSAANFGGIIDSRMSQLIKISKMMAGYSAYANTYYKDFEHDLLFLYGDIPIINEINDATYTQIPNSLYSVDDAFDPSGIPFAIIAFEATHADVKVYVQERVLYSVELNMMLEISSIHIVKEGNTLLSFKCRAPEKSDAEREEMAKKFARSVGINETHDSW